jgi:hypothetical protein
MKIEILEENFLKAHREGCSEVKKALETLAPGVFKTKYPCLKVYNAAPRLVVLFTGPKEGICLEIGHHRYTLGEHRDDWCEDYFRTITGIQEAV